MAEARLIKRKMQNDRAFLDLQFMWDPILTIPNQFSLGLTTQTGSIRTHGLDRFAC